MALKKCKKCGYEFMTNAGFCPECGSVYRSISYFWYIGAGFPIVLVIALILPNNGDDSKGQESNQNSVYVPVMLKNKSSDINIEPVPIKKTLSKKNGEHAAYWKNKYIKLKIAAEEGSPEDQDELAGMYSMTLYGIPHDHKKAVKWYHKAADQGMVLAQHSLGDFYSGGGDGVPMNQKESVKWYRKAAEQGFNESQSMIGYIYFKGEGVPINYIKSYAWFNLAHANGDMGFEVVRDMLNYKLTKKQISEGQKLSESLLRKIKISKEIPIKGKEVPHAFNEMVQWYRETAENGLKEAQFNLALMFDTGRGVPQYYGNAIKWYRKAAEQGVKEAQFNLAIMLENMIGEDRDLKGFLKWYRTAAEHGLKEAQFNLAVMYANGIGVPQNYIKAYAWINLAALEEYSISVRTRNRLIAMMTKEQISKGQKLSAALNQNIKKNDSK